MTQTQTPQGNGADTAAAQRQVLLQKIYVKDVSLEVPLAPQIFTRQWQPEMDVQVNTDVKNLEGDVFHVLLSVTVTAKLGSDVAFLVEAEQAGVFTVSGFDTHEQRQAVLGGYCPGLLFPFLRETVSDLVQRGGFPQLLLQPINFEALYLQHASRQQGAAQQPSGDAPATPQAAH